MGTKRTASIESFIFNGEPRTTVRVHLSRDGVTVSATETVFAQGTGAAAEAARLATDKATDMLDATIAALPVEDGEGDGQSLRDVIERSVEYLQEGLAQETKDRQVLCEMVLVRLARALEG